MKEVTIIHRSGTVRQYNADDVQAHPMILLLHIGDARHMIPWDTIASVEVKITNEEANAPRDNSPQA